jgi:trehalose-phosphatase
MHQEGIKGCSNTFKDGSLTKIAKQRFSNELPSALKNMTQLTAELQGRKPVVFLDFDGTLTPIVDRPELAELSPDMRESVRRLGQCCTLAIVSGRDLDDVRAKVGIDEVFYAGSHGFQIAGPSGFGHELQQGSQFLPALDKAEQSLLRQLSLIPGAQVERKKFAVAIHFRRVVHEQVAALTTVVDGVLADSEGLRKTGGKMIFELRPDIDWDKGKALNWLLEKLQLDKLSALPLYIGDDLTDEDAFRELQHHGIPILVRDGVRPSLALYALESVDEVKILLQRLATQFE